MAYKVIVSFSDLEDNGHLYRVDDDYPRIGVKPTQDRIEFLSTNKNLLGRPVIKAVEKVEGTKEVAMEAKPVMNAPEMPTEAETESNASEDAQEKPKRGRKKKS